MRFCYPYRVGFYIDIDLFYFWMISKHEFKSKGFNLNLKVNKFTFKFWHLRTLEFLSLNFFFDCKIKHYKLLEYYTKFNGNFFYLYPKFIRSRVKKGTIIGQVNNFVMTHKLNYVEQVRAVKSNEQLLNIELKTWIIKYLTHEKPSKLNIIFNLFKGKYKIKNNTSLYLIDWVLFELIKFYEKFNLLIREYNQFLCVAGFWYFQRNDLLNHLFKFCAVSSKKGKHNRYRNWRWLYFFNTVIYKIHHNVMEYIIMMKNQINSIKRVKFFFKSYSNKLYYNNDILLLKKGMFNNFWIIKHNIFTKHKIKNMFYKNKISSLVNFLDEGLSVSKYLNLINKNFYKNFYYNNFKYGSLLNENRSLGYGFLLMVQASRNKLLGNIKYNNCYLLNWIILKNQIMNFMMFILNIKYIKYYRDLDVFYFYKDLFFVKNKYKLWKWYIYWDGIDFHVTWGWFGLIKKKKIKKKMNKNWIKMKWIKYKRFMPYTYWFFKYLFEFN